MSQKNNTEQLCLREFESLHPTITLLGEIPDKTLLPESFLLSYNKTHWSKVEETVKLVEQVINPYVVAARERLGLAADQKALIIWDDFSAHGSEKVW